ncbi:5-methylcytosine-specific restriction protein A [Haloactinospora alba]|uniref:5-methylcytosine-specific restriction protein A n=1 Tax=Haloactinospora alba TaxID=405555 RepID=A0A543NFH6_9ACTN|nr:HNH endonuclease [Haloactinospora alba]TQN30589.1 5-methylcytosine-specific restriction protein A [Haloactinospora alba]
MSGPTKATRALVWERDAGRCARCGLPITREWSLHHRVPRGAGGSRRPELNSPANLVLLCGSATSPKGCHLAVESDRRDAQRTGYLISKLVNLDPAEVPLLYHGAWWVRLDHHGGTTVHAHPAPGRNHR